MHDLPLTLVGGYLGSGKTTWINARLAAAGGVRFAVMVNDFGDLNVDAALIADQGAHTVELTNGCVCCSISVTWQPPRSRSPRGRIAPRLGPAGSKWRGRSHPPEAAGCSLARLSNGAGDDPRGRHTHPDTGERQVRRGACSHAIAGGGPGPPDAHLDQIDAATEFKLESWLAELRAEHDAARDVPDFA